MKVFKRKTFATLMMSSILLLQSLSPLLAVATTVETETTEATMSSEQSSQTSAPATEQSTEEPPAEPVYTEVEKNYEDNELSSDYQEQSAQPAVQFTKKELTKEVTLEGEILSGIEQQEGQRTETRLTKFLLQKKEKDTWEDVQSFVSKKEEEQTIQDQAYTFAYSETLKKGGVYQYRFVVDYEIRRYEEEQLKEVDRHKAHYLIGEVKVKEEAAENSEEETMEESSQMTEESNREIKESAPEILSREEFKAKTAREISPLAVSDIHISGTDINNLLNITNIKKNQATISSRARSVGNDSALPGDIYIVWSTNQYYIRNVIQPSSSLFMNDSDWQRVVAGGNYKLSTETGNGANLIRESQVTITGLSPNTTYYFWMFRKVLVNGPGFQNVTWPPHVPDGTTTRTQDTNYIVPYRFTTDAPDPLTVTKPKFYHDNNTKAGDRIQMAGQRLYGDITPNNYQGTVQISNGVSTSTPVTTLGHDLGWGGTTTDHKYYHSGTITGLTPGTRYQGRIGIKNYAGNLVYSPWGGKDDQNAYFYTSNTVWKPVVQSKNSPTSATNASATLYAAYNVGNVAAHPSNSLVEYKEASSGTWLNAAGTIAQTNNRVNFTLSNLKANTSYQARVSALNASGVWSYASEILTFTTNPVKLVIDPPVFDASKTTSTSVTLGSSGYTGDISTNGNDGILEMSGNSSATLATKFSNVQHSTTRGFSNAKGVVNNVTNGRQITGLTAGTKYQARLQIKDYGTNGSNGVLQPSNQTTICTTNVANLPTLTTNGNIRPTATTKAALSLKGTYKFNSVTSLAAHPTEVLVMTKTNEQADWPWGSPLPTTAHSQNPYVQITSLGGGDLRFTIRNLETSKYYRVAYCLKNAGGYSNWAEYSGGITTLAQEIKIPAQPIFTVSNATSAILNTGSYSGDANRTDLKVQKQTGASSWIDVNSTSYNNVPMNTTQRKYATPLGYGFSGLTPGSKYRSKIMMQYNDSSGQWQDSSIAHGWYEYITPNTVSPPVITKLANIAETPNGAAISVSGQYQVDTQYPQHPKNSGVSDGVGGKGVQIEIKGPTDSVFVPAGSKVSDLQINSSGSTPSISFKLNNLDTAKSYVIRYRVKNDSNLWSEWGSSASFVTKGIDLTLDPPILDQGSATTNSINMIGQRYYGDITQTNNQGAVLITSIGESQWHVVESGVLGHTLGRGDSNTPNNKYNNYLIGGLTPGTQYKAQVHIKNFDGDTRSSQWSNQFAYTKNTIDNLTSHAPSTPTAYNNATATFTAGYQAGGNPLATITEVPAHPTKVNVYLSTDGLNYDLLDVDSGASGPRLFRDDDINTSGKTSTFKIEGLLENTHYYVKYSVINGGGESSLSAPYDFTTLSRPDGLYINERPAEFDFGTVDFSSNNSTHPLEDTSGNETAVDFENINVNNNWSLSAKLSELKVDGESHLKLVGSSITLNNQLKETTDDGTTWTPADPTKLASGVNTTGPITLLADDSTSVELFKTADIPYGQSRFRNIIPLSSVSLFIPGNQGVKGKEYEGHITWTLNATA